MRVLAVTSDFPLPLDRGGPVRTLGLCRGIAAQAELHLLARARPDTTQTLVERLSDDLGAPVELFRDAGTRGHLASTRAARWARSLAGGRPPWIDAQHLPPLERRVRELVADFDALVLLDDYAAIYARSSGQTPVVIDKHNVMGFSAAAAPAPSSLAGRSHRSVTLPLIRRFERTTARQAGAVVVTSEEESRRFRALYGRTPEAVVPSAIDLPPETTSLAPATVGWLGSHEYPVNVEGLLRFVEEAWEPLGREGLRLRIAGNRPPQAVRELERFPGVHVLGFVERLEDFLGGLGAAVVPLWSGAGVKLKTLTFMGAGVPTVATSVALEGIAAEHERHCLFAEEPQELADGLRRLTGDPQLSRRMGAEGRQLIRETLTWEDIAPRFVEAVERAAYSERAITER